MYGFPVTSVLACAVACLCVVGTNALLEGIPDAGTGSSKTSIKNYLDLLKPGISSLCNFASHDGVASAECLACTDSLKLLIDHFIEQRTWAVMSKLICLLISCFRIPSYNFYFFAIKMQFMLLSLLSERTLDLENLLFPAQSNFD